MTQHAHENETGAPASLHGAELMVVQVLNILALVALILVWPILAVVNGVRRPGPVVISVTKDHLPGGAAAQSPVSGDLRLAA